MKLLDWKLHFNLSPAFAAAIVWVLIVLIGGAIIVCEYWDWIGGESGSAILRYLALAATAMIGLPIAVWRSLVAERQANSAQEQAENSRRGLLSERFQRSSEMLSSDEVWVCTAGIAGLNRLAQDHPTDYHIQVMELLCTFIQHSSRQDDEATHGPGNCGESDGGAIPANISVHAALKAIGSRDHERIELEDQSGYTLYLNYADLRNQNFASLNFSKVHFQYSDLSGSNLAHANFSDADLLEANLSNSCVRAANFQRAKLHFSKMSRIEAGPSTDFSGAIFDSTELTDAQLAGANFLGAMFSNTKISGAVFWKRNRTVAKGITQRQFDNAVPLRRDGSVLPSLGQLTDHETGERIRLPSMFQE